MSAYARSISASGVRIAMAETTALELDGVFSGYGETVIVEDVRLAVKAGETLAIIGRNGVGKTTLLSTVMGHNTLHRGRVSLSGKDITRLPPYLRVAAGLGYVPQEREIFPSLTLRENLDVAVRQGLWTVEAVFELFPRLRDRQRNWAANCRAASSRCWRSAGACGQSGGHPHGRAFGRARARYCRRTHPRGPPSDRHARTDACAGGTEHAACTRYLRRALR